MPEQRCERDGEQGWRWGETGKCYLPSEEGSAGKAKRKAILQGVAIGELDEMSEITVTELASIVDVPILTVGVFPFSNQKPGQLPLIVEEKEIDDIIRGSNLLQPLIREAINTGFYRGNLDLKTRNKPIPGLLNLRHQKPFRFSETLSKPINATLKEAVKDVSVSFHKQNIPDEHGILKPWIVERFENVPPDIATTLVMDYPYRSVEIIPLDNPDTGETFPKIIRSTAFLDRFTRKAVKGQSPDLIVELAGPEEPLITITTCQKQGENTMVENTQSDLASVAELQEMKATLTKQKTEHDEMKAELTARVEAVELARQEAVELAITNEKAKDEKIAELQAAQDMVGSERIITEMSNKVRKYGDRAYMLSPAFMDVITPSIEKKGVIKLAEGENLRQKYADLFESVIELAGKNAILIPIETSGPRSFQSPDSTPKTEDEKVQDLMSKNPELTKQEAFIEILNAQYGRK